MSRSSYDPNRRAWSDAFHPQVKAILGQCFFTAAPPELDYKENIDLMILRMTPNLAVAVRLRRWEQNQQYRDQLTIRSFSNGHETEFDKIQRGKGMYFFYGFASNEIGGIVRWSIWNLDAFRSRISLLRPLDIKSNGDGTGFRAYRLSHLAAFEWNPIIYVASDAITRCSIRL